MTKLMERFQRALGYEADAGTEHAKADQRLNSQQLRLNALDAAIAAQNAAPRYRGPERRKVPRL